MKAIKILKAIGMMFLDILVVCLKVIAFLAILAGWGILAYYATVKHEVIAMVLYYAICGLVVGLMLIVIPLAIADWFRKHYE